MAEIVSIHAASHTPVMINFADAIAAADRDRIFAAFRQVGQEILAARPDAVIVVSDDHVHNFFMNNFPAFCIGAAASYPTPVEHWLKVDKQILRGDPGLGAHLLGEALQGGFDPAFSMDLTLDHGILTPLHLADVAADVAVVPLLVNCVQPPLPPMSRALQWGQLLARAVSTYAGCERVSILATGGISHDIATPRMGMVNEAFDRGFLQRLGGDDDTALVRFAAEHVNEAGNGAEEIRTWLVAHGVARVCGAAFQPILYEGVANWYTGIGLGRWATGGAGMTRPALHFRDDGPDDAPAVVLLHSLATHAELWAPQRAVWAGALRLISVDLPGHGGSPNLPHTDTLAGMADEVVAVLDGLGIAHAAIVGLSLGGMVAQALALRHPGRVRSLVIAHAGARTDDAVREIWNQRIAQFEAGDQDALCQSTLQRWFPRDFAERAPLTLAWVAGLIRATSAAGYVSAIRAIQGLDHMERLSAITVPTLVVAGQADAAVPAAVAHQLVERLPQGRLHLLEDTGHLGNVQAPVRFTEVVGQFLLQTAGQAQNTMETSL